MALEIRKHVETRGDNPLDAVIAGTQHKAYLVALHALHDEPQAAADHYAINRADVHGAVAFYYDYETAINDAIDDARQLGQKMGAVSGQDLLAAIRQRTDSA